jgi:hypothetical protein
VSIGASALPLPRWAYVPGKGGEADHVTLCGVKVLVPARFGGFVPMRHPALNYGLALNDAGFFWECHEILEGVWAAAPQGGRDRILLRACIQTTNANLKQKLGRPSAVIRLIGEALAELNELGLRKAEHHGFAGAFPAGRLASSLRHRLDESSADDGPVMFEFEPGP